MLFEGKWTEIKEKKKKHMYDCSYMCFEMKKKKNKKKHIYQGVSSSNGGVGGWNLWFGIQKGVWVGGHKGVWGLRGVI